MNGISNGNVHPMFGPIGEIAIGGRSLRYLSQGSGWRYETLLEKEPETIRWIRCFNRGDLLWDIGANVGIYSLFAALQGTRVLAFEPHFANYFQLCANVCINDAASEVLPICLSFARATRIERLNMVSVDFGTSMSSFGSTLDFRGNAFEPAFAQGMLGIGIDRFISTFGAEVPNHIKIDVDGLELEIVESAVQTLALPAVRSVSVELIEGDTAQTSAVRSIMNDCGFDFICALNNPAFATPQTQDVKNYLFVKSNSAGAAS